MRFRSTTLRRAASALAALATIAGSMWGVPQAQGATAKKVVHSYTLSSGVTLRTIRYSTPNQVRMLIIHPQSAPTIEQIAAGDFGNWALVSTQGQNNGAVAAVNGDFGSFSGMPSHYNLVDGEIRTSGLMGNQAFAWNASGSQAYASSPPRKVVASAPTGKFQISHLNAGTAGPAQFVAFTPVGGSKEKPASSGMCSAKMVPSGPLGWADTSKSGVTRAFTVTNVPACGTSIGFGSTAPVGSMVLQVRSACTCAKKIKGLAKNDTVKVTWSSWPGIVDQIGAQPQLVSKGVNVAPGPNTSSNYFYGKNPRTGVGISKGCTDTSTTSTCVVYIITVDGRQSGWSSGMTLPQFAHLFLTPNPPAYDAVNLDGGGATEMWVGVRSSAYCQSGTPGGGCLVDRPSDGSQRGTVTSLEVLPGSDTGTNFP